MRSGTRDRGEPLAPEQPGEITEWLLGVNLLNLMGLPGKERTDVLAEVRRRATRVARQHGAVASDLSNIGVLLMFRDDDPDQCFKVLCAALLLAESLDNFNEALHIAARPEMKFRFGVHVTTHSSDASPRWIPMRYRTPSYSARSRRKAPSRRATSVRASISPRALHRGRTDQSDPAHACHGVTRQLVIVSAVADAYGAALDHQAELLRSQEDSTSTPSTL